MVKHPSHIETPGSSPLLRVWLCGPFEMAWVDPATGASQPLDPATTGRDRGPALSLLKLLLCQPERQAPRDWIMEQFWPEHSRSVATHRLENVFSRLRKLLTPPGGGESLLHSLRGKRSSGPSYGLDASPILWVDSDAAIWHVEQAARMERFGDDSLPFWQRAFALLSRGPFLADEPYATWVIEQRAVLDGSTRQCVHALAHLYLAHYGEAGKAEALLLLRTYWQQHKTDEDALRPLMELLGEQERYQEAEAYYLQAREELQQERKEFDHRTEDLFEYIHMKPIQRKALPYAVAAPPTGYLPLLPVHNQRSFTLPQPTLSAEVFPDQTLKQHPTIMDSSIMNNKFLSSPFIELQKRLALIVGALNISTSEDHEEYMLSRRQMLLAITALTMPLFASSEKHLSHMGIDALLSSLATSIESCWQLSNEFDILAVSSVLSIYLPSLVTITKQSPLHRKRAAHLTAQAFLLQAIVDRHVTGLRAAEASCQEAVVYSQIAEDPILYLTTLRHLAMICYYAKRPKEEGALYQRMNALLSHDATPPLLQSFVYAGWAGTQALHGLQQEALTSLSRARETFFLQSPTDNVPLYIDYNYSQLFISEGLTYYDLGCYQEALESFLQVDGLSPKVPVTERGRLEFLNCQALTMLRLPHRDRDMQQCIDYWTAGIKGAIALKSRQRYDEACQIYEFMKFVWPHEAKVKALQEMTAQWEKSETADAE